MTVSSTTRKAGPYTGNGVSTAFPFAFKVFATSDVLVVKTDLTPAESTMVENVDYTIALNLDQDAAPGGTINTTVPLPNLYLLTATSQVLELQPADIQNASGFYPQVLEDALDRVTILAQQIKLLATRGLRIPLSSSASGDLPSPVANNLLGWDSLGASIINYAGVASSAVSAAMAPVVAAATLALARTALGITAIGNSLVTAATAAAARLTLGIGAYLQLQSDTAFTTGGTSTAYTLVTSPASGALTTNERYRVKFNQASGAAPTLARDGLAAKSLKQYNNFGNKVAAVIASGQLADIEYDGTDYVVLDPLSTTGNFAGQTFFGTTGQTLTSAHWGQQVAFGITGAGTVTLMAANSGSKGQEVAAYNYGTGNLTVNRAGADTLYAQGVAGGTSVVLAPGDGIVFGTDGTSVFMQAGQSAGVGGGGQVWTDMTGSRAVGTTYTNSTGKPIEISVRGLFTAVNNNATLTIGGIVLDQSHAYAAGASYGFKGIVPNGATYSVNNVAGTFTPSVWAELR